MAKRLYVGNLGYGVTSEDLQQLFETYGAIKSAQVLIDRETGRSRGFGFVEMDDDREAEAAIANLDGSEHQNRRLNVNEAKPRTPGGGGGGGVAVTAVGRGEDIEMNDPVAITDLKSRVEAVIEREVRPGLMVDGGDVEVVDVDPDRIVQIRLLGSCQGCASSIYSTTMVIEAAVKAAIPEIRFLEAVL